ncbi:amidohydrolase family protein [Arthrobacter dokdonensis]|uniref:amidohydrolase family protein n=1 Tax=Arthrobacter dokdonellae TaxID=2211210 RepID=UPI000DE5C24B|nr:amidohydrolase family protein [Arthrobacter dokdonellae]
MTFKLIDAHHHLADLSRSYPWLEQTGPYPYHGDDSPIRHSYLLEDYLSDVNGLTLLGSVHIENGAADPRAETAWIDTLATEAGIPSVQVSKVDLLSPDASAQLEYHASFPSVRGIRHILNWHENPRYTHTSSNTIMSDPRWVRNFARLAPLGLSFDLQVFPSQLAEAAALAASHPETTIILDHAGMPIGRDAASIHAWREGMRTMAAQPNVVVKISALGTNDHHWTVNSLRPFILDTLEIFGPERSMFGSNFPVDSLYSTYAQLIEAYDQITSVLSEDERQAFFARTAARTYRIPGEWDLSD